MTLAARLVGIVLLVGPAFGETLDPAATSLTIEVRRAPGLEAERYTLACDPPAGSVPDPAGACRRIAKLVGDASSPSMSSRGRGQSWLLGSEVLCEPVCGGPEIMTVRGIFAGQRVDGRFTREDGCAMSAYDQTEWVLGVPGSRAGGDAATL